MDDAQFKTEVLARLDRIVALLSASCAMSKAALERLPQPEPRKHETLPAGEAGNGQYLLQDEMQDDYAQAVQKWRSSKGGAAGGV